jgi:hypothetical protein
MGITISNNPTPWGIRWRWRAIILTAGVVLLSAVVFPSRSAELAGVSFVLLIMAYSTRALEDDYLIVVIDHGEAFEFVRGSKRATIPFASIERADLADNNEGWTIVTLYLSVPCVFGQSIAFRPAPDFRFEPDEKKWFKGLEGRIAKSRTHSIGVPSTDKGHRHENADVLHLQTWM